MMTLTSSKIHIVNYHIKDIESLKDEMSNKHPKHLIVYQQEGKLQLQDHRILPKC